MDKPAVYRIVLTGGPCGGKSTCLSAITDRLQGLGFHVYRVPETATILLGGGVSMGDVSPSQMVGIQAEMLHVMMALEDSFLAVASATGRPSIILCDRGTMDASAYLPPESWTAVLDEHDWTVVGLRDRRYEAVIHLVTAADGAEAFYTTENNTVRTETLAQARLLDQRVRNAWVGHPHLRVIDNSTNFARKVQRVTAAVSHVIGVPEPQEIERKFLLRPGPAEKEVPVRFEGSDIEQTYLIGQHGWEARVRRRGQHGSYTYTNTLKRPVTAGQRVEIERQITGRDYIALLAQADPARRTIKKLRRVFLWKNQYFEWDIFVSPRPGLELLEVEVNSLEDPVELPPFLTVEREVTADGEYANYRIALETINVDSRSDDPRVRRLSNFSPDPFVLDGEKLASVEGFIQGIKFPVGHPDRELAFRSFGKDAKRIGSMATRDFAYWQDKRITYGSAEHHELIERAIRAKFEQNPGAMKALLATDGVTVIHDLGEPESPGTSFPAKVFCEILMRIRSADH